MTKDEIQIEAAKAAITKKRSALPYDHPLEMAIREIDYRKNRIQRDRRDAFNVASSRASKNATPGSESF